MRNRWFLFIAICELINKLYKKAVENISTALLIQNLPTSVKNLKLLSNNIHSHCRLNIMM